MEGLVPLCLCTAFLYLLNSFHLTSWLFMLISFQFSPIPWRRVSDQLCGSWLHSGVNPQPAGFMLSPATFSWPWCLPELSSSRCNLLMGNKAAISCSPPPHSVCLQGSFSPVSYQQVSEVLQTSAMVRCPL